jgi:hypothetical protein
MPPFIRFDVLVPTPGSPYGQRFAQGSAIVVIKAPRPGPGNRLYAYYESNEHDAVNARRFVERVAIAAGRAAGTSPTTKIMVVPAGEFTSVGSYDPISATLTLEREDLLKAWVTDEDPIGRKLRPFDGVRP